MSPKRFDARSKLAQNEKAARLLARGWY